MGRSGIAALGVAAFFALLAPATQQDALAAPRQASARMHGASVSELSSQARRVRRARTRITVYPRTYVYPLIGPRHFGFDAFPRPYPFDWPGPYAKRDCVGWLTVEARPSGPVVVPRRRCVWVPG